MKSLLAVLTIFASISGYADNEERKEVASQTEQTTTDTDTQQSENG